MKNFSKFLTIAILVMAFGVSAHAQVNATANASATIVSPIAIAKATDMNFGNIAPSAAGGTVILAPDGTRTPAGVTLPITTGTVAAASFNVTGTINYTYSITLPAGATTISNGGNNMTVDTWTSTPTPAGNLGGTGAQTLSVGATLHVGAAQASGTYTSAAPFTVTVNYN